MPHGHGEITIPTSLIEKITKNLKLKNEVAGTLQFDKDKLKTSGVCTLSGFRLTKGGSDWVHTPLSPINFHTHPSYLYERENVKWGWPSGEDLRECILFGMSKKHLFHVVFTREGVYTIQTTPCFRKFLSRLESLQVGIVVSVLESVFKSTHNLRTIKFNQKYPVSPDDWVKMTNTLRLGMFFKLGKETCGKITCNKIKVVNPDNTVTSMALGKYLSAFEGKNLETYVINGKGTITNTVKTKIPEVMKILKEISGVFEETCPKSRIFNITFNKYG